MRYTSDCRYQCQRHTKTVTDQVAMATCFEPSHASSLTSSGHGSPLSSWFESRANHPTRASANSYWIGSHPWLISGMRAAATSPIATCKALVDGEPSVDGGHCLNVTGRAVLHGF